MTTPGWYPNPLGGSGTRYWNGAQWDGVPSDEVPQDLPPEKPQRARFLVPILIGAVGVMGGMLLMLLWPRSQQAPSPVLTSSAAPRTVTSTAPAPTPTTAPAEEVADMVRNAMQRKFDSDPDASKLGLKVLDVKLVNKSGNEYKGIATIRAGNGAKDDVPVEVTADGDNVLWETPPGAFEFAIPDYPTQAPRTSSSVPGADSLVS